MKPANVLFIALSAILFMSVTEAFGGVTTGEFLRVYDAQNRTLGDGRTVPHDSRRVYADFRYRNWPDNYYEWVSVRINGGSESRRIPISTLQRAGNTINWIPINVSGYCGNVEAVLWTGRRGASPATSDTYRFTVDCEPPRITVRAYELGGMSGGRYVTPQERRDNECSGGTGHRFDVQVRDDKGLRMVTTTLEGRALRQGGGRVTHYSGTRSSARQDISFQRQADTPGSTRPAEDTSLTLVVEATETSGRLTRKRISLRLGARLSENLLNIQIERPASRTMIPFTSSWQITGRVSSRSCAFQPGLVELWHTIPGGVPGKVNEVRTDRSGRFSFRIAGRSIPVGSNVFNVNVPVATSGTQLQGLSREGRRNRIEIQITLLRQDTINQLKTLTPGIAPQKSLSNRPLVEAVPRSYTPTPAADKVKNLNQNPSTKAIRNKGLSDKALRGINP